MGGHQLRAAGRRLRRHARLHPADEDGRLPAHAYIPTCTFRCTPVNWLWDWCRRRGCASISARPWSWRHAERIGHGVDVMYEDDPRDLLKEMVEKHVMIEINLSSNEAILGVEGRCASVPGLPRGAGAGGAFDRRRGREPHRPDARVREGGARLQTELQGPEANGADRDGTQISAGRELVGRSRTIFGTTVNACKTDIRRR